MAIRKGGQMIPRSQPANRSIAEPRQSASEGSKNLALANIIPGRAAAASF
jgi:hypothetical protein